MSLIVTLSYFTVKWFIEPVIVKKQNVPVVEVVYIRTLRSYSDFVKAVAFRESGGNYKITNQYGMLGAFQFSQKYLPNVGITVSAEDFLNNEELQRGVFKQLLLINYRNNQALINKWNYKSIKGVKGTVTTSGILMAFHLCPQSAITFFNSSGSDLGKPDGNGVYVNQYVQLFSGYEIPF